MLKAIVSYSKKIPVPDSEYSSQGYSLSLETEIPENEPGKIQTRLHETFELVKQTVEQELANGNGQGKPSASQTEPAGSGRNGTGEKASNKQVKYITDLATERGIRLSELNAGIQKRCGATSLYDLSKKQASEIVEDLKTRKPLRKAA